MGIAGVGNLRCGNSDGCGNWGGSNSVNIGSSNWGRGGGYVNVGNGSNIGMNISFSGNFSVNISLSGDIFMNIWDSSDIFMNIRFSSNIFMNIGFSFDIFMNIWDSFNFFMNISFSGDVFMNIGFSFNLRVDVRFSEGIDLSSVVVRVDNMMKCGGNGNRGSGMSS